MCKPPGLFLDLADPAIVSFSQYHFQGEPMEQSQYKKMRFTYGFEEVALVPGDITINPDQTDISLVVDRLTFPIPILASAMDGVVDVKFAIAMGRLGGLAVLNLEGVQTRYSDPQGVLDEIAAAPPETATQVLQRIYSEPIKQNLVGDCVRAIKDGGAVCAVSLTPANTNPPETTGAVRESSPVGLARHSPASRRFGCFCVSTRISHNCLRSDGTAHDALPDRLVS